MIDDEEEKFTLKRIRIISYGKISIIISDGKNDIETNIELGRESYTILSKFIAYKWVGALEENTDLSAIKQDSRVITNLSQSKNRFLENVNNQLAANRIRLTQEHFFTKKGVGKYEFSLDVNKKDLPEQKKHLNEWLRDYLIPALNNQGIYNAYAKNVEKLIDKIWLL
jgi:hypothetical protein